MERFLADGLLVAVLIGVSHSYAIFKLSLLEFDNQSGRIWNGDCCDICVDLPGMSNPAAPCDTVLQICLTRENHIIFSSGKEDEESCAYYQHTTMEHTNMDSINLSRYIGEITVMIMDYLGSLQIGVYAEDVDDSFIPDEKIDMHSVIINDVPDNCEQRLWKQGTSDGMRSNRRTRLQYRYQLYCACGYYGSRCSTMCTPHNDSSGHYTCDQNTGHKICLQGWTGEECRIKEDDCHSHVCQNEATCVDGESSYQCVCKAGYTGTHCETPIDECASAPCLHGSCTDLDDSYVCHCDLGYEGQECQSHVCDNITCINGGVCNDYRLLCEKQTQVVTIAAPQASQGGSTSQAVFSGWQIGLVVCGLLLIVIIAIIIVYVACKRNPRANTKSSLRNKDQVINVTTIEMVSSDTSTMRRISVQSVDSIDRIDGAINNRPHSFVYITATEATARYGAPPTARSAHNGDDSSESMQPVPESMQPVPESMQPVPESMQPVPESMQPVPESMQPVLEYMQLVPESNQLVPEYMHCKTELRNQTVHH